MPAPSRSQLAVYAVLAVAALAIAGRWLATRAGGSERPSVPGARVAPPGDGGRALVSTPAPQLVVHVAGAVRRPGVYRLRRGDRVEDAVRRAGGVSSRGDVNGVNLAAPAQDGVQIVVPTRVAAASAAPSSAGAAVAGAAPTAPVNLNTATAEQLDTLDGVGPATAAKILDYRRQHGGFRSIDDLGQVSGIGPKRLAALRGKVST